MMFRLPHRRCESRSDPRIPHESTTHQPIALVTGTSSGIGKVTAERLAAAGFRVFGTSRRAQVDVRGATMLTMDVRSDESVRSCVQTVLDRVGRIDVLINNAGVACQGFAEETSWAELDNVIETNFFGPIRVCDAALPGMRERRYGRIVNIGSAAAWVGEPGDGYYAASKAALARYSDALRYEVWHLGIAVSLVEPGVFRTSVLNNADMSDDATAGRITDYDGPREAARATLQRSLGKGGEPSEVANLILRIVRARRPLARYGAGADGRWLPRARVLLPQRLFDHVLRRSFGLPEAPRPGRDRRW